MHHLSPAGFLTVNILAALAFVPFLLRLNKGQAFDATGIWLGLLAITLSTTASLAYSYAIRSMDVSKAVLITGGYPALTCLLAVLLLGETMTWTKTIGMVLVLSGVAVVNH